MFHSDSHAGCEQVASREDHLYREEGEENIQYMKEKSVYANMILNILRTSLYVIFPLITFPYVSRVLMAENLGKVNYALSIENYFALIAALGISTYGVREGACLRSDRKALQRFADEIFTVNVITTIISYASLGAMLVLVPKFHDYAVLILLQSLSILFTTLGVDWINSMFEDYLYITVRSFIVQVVLLAAMFLFVKKPDDYYRYALISVLSNAITCTLNFFYTRRYCKVRIVRNCRFFSHLKQLLVFFANNLAVNIYLNADTTMLGLFTNDFTVGIYSVAVKIYNVIKSIIAAMFTACIPRLSAYFAEGKIEEYKALLNDIISICTLLMLPAIGGLICLAKPIVLIVSGSEFTQATSSLSIISIGIIGATYGGIATNCLNLTMKRERYNLYGTVIAAIVNVALNFIFIPLFEENGAAVTTVIAEFTVLFFCLFSFKEVRKYINFSALIPDFLIGLSGCAMVILLSLLVNHFFTGIFMQMASLVVFSVLGYMFILRCTKNPLYYRIRNMFLKFLTNLKGVIQR